VVLVAGASVAARLWLFVDRPLWFDEIFTVWAARLPLDTLLAILTNDSGPPLFYVLEKPFVLAGERLLLSDLGARVLPFAATLALFAGAFTLPSRPARLRFTLLASASPLLLLYSAEARAYALLALLCFALFLLAAVARETPAALAATALLSAAALYTHYLAILAVGALVLVALAEKRARSALAVLAGALPFLFWVPVLTGQPPEAVAWMRERPGEIVVGILSALGGAGRVPPPLGPPLPAPLVAIGAVLALLLAGGLALRWRVEPALRRALAFLVLFLGAAVFASIGAPVAFAGRTEMAVLPVWLWAIALGAEESRFVRVTAIAALLAAAVSSALALSAPRTESLPAKALDALVEDARPDDVLFAGAHFYLPARLAADRGRLPLAVRAFPAEQAAHPGWSAGAVPSTKDLRAVETALERAGAGGRVFFQVPPSYGVAIEPLVAGRGITRRLGESPEMLFLVWSRD
jgi:hypothetical protein